MDETAITGASRRHLLKGIALTSLAMTGIRPVLAQAARAGVLGAKPWWTDDYRIVQTNLREIDVLEDPREIARAVKDLGATAIVSNIGGIVAFYPTRLKYQRTNPFLRGDFVKEMIAAAHAEGLVYLGRFDTSKATKPVYDAHPNWFGVYADGQPTEYAGTYQACPNGGWLQDYSLRILREALTAYKPDGVFFNGVGFGVNDYGGRNRGFCVCANCGEKFREMYGLEMPRQFNFSDPSFRPYLQFVERVTGALFERMEKIADELIPGMPIIRGEDYRYVGRGEVQRRVRRPAPEWAYQAGEQTRRAKAKEPAKPFSATSAAHIDYPWRQVAESADVHINRFAQMLGNGGRLDLYLMGTPSAQYDQSYLPPLAALFKWHGLNWAHYAGTSPAARVGLYDSDANALYSAATRWDNYCVGSSRGAYAMLIDSRLPFQFINGEAVAQGKCQLEGFDLIVAPHVLCMSDKEAAALDAFVAGGGLLIASGMTAGFDSDGRPRRTLPLACFPLAAYGQPQSAEGWVLDSARGELRHSINPTPVDGHYFGGRLRNGVRDLLPFMPDIRWGPPEYSYAEPGAKRRTVPGLLAVRYGRGHAVHVPFPNEWQYHRDGLPVNQMLLEAIVRRYAPAQPFVLTGKGSAELTVLRNGNGDMLLHVINYAGQRNGRYDAPPELHGLRLGVHDSVVSEARALVSGVTLRGARRPGEDRLWYDLPPVGAFEAVVLTG